MTPRTTSRPRPIPFGALNAPEPSAPPAPLPVRFSAAAQRRAPAPIPWGMPVGTAASVATVATVEDPRALYEVARRWQGQSVPEAAPASASAAARRPTSAPTAPLTGDTHARYTGQGSLCVRSSVTGRHYRFARHGDTLRIDKHDLSLLRRIADIELA